MSENEHTKGEWVVDKDKKEVRNQADELIAAFSKIDCSLNKEYTLHENRQANAQLISAAPDLLKACQFAFFDLMFGSNRELIDRVRKAICKAQDLSADDVIFPPPPPELIAREGEYQSCLAIEDDELISGDPAASAAFESELKEIFKIVISRNIRQGMSPEDAGSLVLSAVTNLIHVTLREV